MNPINPGDVTGIYKKLTYENGDNDVYYIENGGGRLVIKSCPMIIDEKIMRRKFSFRPENPQSKDYIEFKNAMKLIEKSIAHYVHKSWGTIFPDDKIHTIRELRGNIKNIIHDDKIFLSINNLVGKRKLSAEIYTDGEKISHDICIENIVEKIENIPVIIDLIIDRFVINNNISIYISPVVIHLPKKSVELDSETDEDSDLDEDSDSWDDSSSDDDN